MAGQKYNTALIVGAGEGLSASLARLFSREGIKVALAARKIEKLGELCTKTGAKAFACDASNADEVERLFGLVEREIATPDIVVYNASGRARGTFVDLVAADVAQAMTVITTARRRGGSRWGRRMTMSAAMMNSENGMGTLL